MTRRALGALLLLVVTGCGKTMNDEDCRRLGAGLRDVWVAEAARAALSNGTTNDKARGVMASQADKLVADWSAGCKKELEGRKVNAKEVDCLFKAKTIADVGQCATAP
jgi:hypothetical protein